MKPTVVVSCSTGPWSLVDHLKQELIADADVITTDKPTYSCFGYSHEEESFAFRLFDDLTAIRLLLRPGVMTGTS